MKKVFLALSFVLVGCSTTAPKESLGKVVIQQLVCNSPEACRNGLNAACPKGGVIHRAGPVMLIEFNCNK